MSHIGLCAVEIADREIAEGAREVGGNNLGPWVEKYLNANHPEQITHQGEPWCAAFVCWCWLKAADKCSVKLAARYTRSCSTLLTSLTALNQAQLQHSPVQAPTAPLTVEPGDLLFYDSDGNGIPNHVNMVHHIDADENVYTVGGNEGSEASGSPVKVKNKGPLLSISNLFAVGWMVPR